MTKKEDTDFRQMYWALKRILQYMTPAQIERDSRKSVLDNLEYLEMAYENIQQDAKSGLRGVRLPKELSGAQKG